MNRIAWLVVLFACSDKKSEPAAAPIEPLGLVLTESGLGPIGASTSAKAEALRPLLPNDLEVRAEYAPGLEPDKREGFGPGEVDIVPDAHIYAGKELVAIVIPDVEGKVMAIRVISPRVVSERGWRTGKTLSDTKFIAGCQCIGDGLLCSPKGSRMGVILDEDCSSKYMDGSDGDLERYRGLSKGDDTAIATLRGKKVRMLSWWTERFKPE